MPLKKFLNQELEGTDSFETKEDKEKQRIMARLREKRSEFEAVMKVARAVFHGNAFRKWAPRSISPEPTWSRSISLPLWDAGYSALTELLKEFKAVQFTQAKANIVSALQSSFETGFFAQETAVISDKTFLARKDELKRLIRDAMQQDHGLRDSHRTFDVKLRVPLYEQQGGNCAICKQSIDVNRLDDGQYVQIDHIIPHSRGGSTTESNAQLVHSECNHEKGASMAAPTAASAGA